MIIYSLSKYNLIFLIFNEKTAIEFLTNQFVHKIVSMSFIKLISSAIPKFIINSICLIQFYF